MTISLAQLAMCLAQVTLFTAGALALTVLAMRRSPGLAAWVAAAALSMVAVITAGSFAPWPRWAQTPVPAGAWPLATFGPAQDGLPWLIGSLPAEPLGEPSAPGRGPLARGVPRATETATVAPTDSGRRSWWVMVVWAALGVAVLGFLAAWGRLALAGWWLARLRRTARPIDDPRLIELVHSLGQQLEQPVHCQIRETMALSAPATLGWRRPVVLLPADWRSWEPEVLRAVLAHELVHVGRRDALVWSLALGIRAMHFYHPLVRWLVARLQAAQELATDAWAARLAGGTQIYLRALAQLALDSQPSPAAWPARGFLAGQSMLAQRVAALAHAPSGAGGGSAGWISRAGSGSLLVALALSVLGLRTAPLAAESPPAGSSDSTPTAQKSNATVSDGSGESYLLSGEPTGSSALNVAGELRLTGSFEVVPAPWSYLPSDAAGLVSLNRDALAKDLNNWPRMLELDTGSIVSQLFERDVVSLTRALPSGAAGGILAVVTSRAIDWAALYRGAGIPVEETVLTVPSGTGDPRVVATGQPFRILVPRGASTEGVYVAHPRLAIVGDLNQLSAMLEGRGRRGWFDWSTYVGSHTGDFLVVLPADASLWNFMRQVTGDFSPEVEAQLSPGLRALVGAGRSGSTPGWVVSLRYITPADAQAALPRVGPLVEALARFAAEPSPPEVQVSGHELLVRGTAPLGGEFLMPALKAAALSAQRIRSMQRLKQIGLAWHNYLDAHRSFPPMAIYHADGRPLLSWRVMILPYLGETELAARFRLDEPWDSPHNSRLLEWMPLCYRRPDFGQKGDYNTNVVSTVGPHLMFEGQTGRRVQDIVDGTAETIMLIETETDIPWSKPLDLEIDLEHPSAGIRKLHGEVFVTGFGDGSAHAISPQVDDKLLRSLLTIDGREPLELP